MATRKTSTKTATIDPVALTTAALKAIKTAADYYRVHNTTESDVFKTAWDSLTNTEQNRIDVLILDNEVDIHLISNKLSACSSKIQLEAVKAEHGELAVRTAWKLLSQQERDRIKALCNNEHQSVEETPQPVTETPTIYNVDSPTQHPRRSLFNISEDLERLNELLDEVGDDTQQQELIQQWFEQLGEERDKKLDGYAALITEMTARAAVRKAEGQRLNELAASDESRARLLKDRLKVFFETHNLKTVETSRYKLQIQRNGGKAPLILDESVPANRLPEQFQRVSINPDTVEIREALERGEHLNFAALGERGTSLRIK